MSNVGSYLWLIPGLPLLASALTAFLGPRWLKEQSHWPCILAVIGSCVLSFVALGALLEPGQPPPTYYYQWFQAGNVDVGLTLRLDGLSAFMIIVVTFIGSWIAIYSAGYMHGDPGYARYFAEIALFVAAMLLLVLADNFLVLYAGWEGVGLCSYLLIGFWYAKPAAAAAARKAFLVTRLGDVGLILGIILIWAAFRYPNTPAMFPGAVPVTGEITLGRELGHALNYETVLGGADRQDETLLALVSFLLLCGAVGKSAQFPLHVWLPDAMEGPSPVSALIHAATMVTAGVYLIARCLPLFHAAPQYVLLAVAGIGGISAFLAAVIALTQNDLKRVLAYSTISQLGYMFLALGSGTHRLFAFAVVAAIFHLGTHAFFKALLFLSAGSVMHGMGNVIDMRRFGGLRKVLPITHWTFLCGALALAGIVPFAGFWSKDEILSAAYQASRRRSPVSLDYLVLFLIGLVTAGLTAFYTFRAYFKTFWGEQKVPPEAGHHVHEPRVMMGPLVVLAVGAVGAGLLFGPTHILANFLERHWIGKANSGFPRPLEPQAHDFHLGMMGLSTLVALAGVGLAYLMYVRRPGLPAEMVQGVQGLYQWSLNKLFFDELYDFFVVRPMTFFAELARLFDQVVDGGVDLVGHLPGVFGRLLRPIQNGLVQFYALAMVLGLAVFLGAMLLRW